jgi:hypothetical protein
MKTREAHTLVDNLQHTFTALNKYQWKLNPKKCIFGVPCGILLGNIVSYDGICPNPTKVKVILDMQPPKKYQGYPEAHWMYGRLKPFHLMTRRKGLAFLQVT